jgi:Domain of Unknown Function (DUF928)
MKINLAVSLAIVGCAIACPQIQLVQAESATLFTSRHLESSNIKQNSRNDSASLIFVARASDDRERNGDRKAGANHGGGNKCHSVTIPVTALVPGKESVAFKASTAQERPTFWLYVPYTSKLTAEFVMKNEQNQPLYAKPYIINLTGQPGIVGITTPKALEVGKSYRWTFSVICDSQDRSADMYVNGKITVVKPTPNLTPAKNSKPEQKAVLYAKDGLWFETLTTIIKDVRRTNPSKAGLFMNNLLQSYELQNLANEKIVK